MNGSSMFKAYMQIYQLFGSLYQAIQYFKIVKKIIVNNLKIFVIKNLLK